MGDAAQAGEDFKPSAPFHPRADEATTPTSHLRTKITTRCAQTLAAVEEAIVSVFRKKVLNEEGNGEVSESLVANSEKQGSQPTHFLYDI